MASSGPAPRGRWDSLSEVQSLESTVFVGRLPKRVDIHALYGVLSQAGQIRQIVPARDTYLFCEYNAPQDADNAVRALNGAAVGGSRICVSQAGSLKRIFVGNLSRTLDARTLHDAIAEIAGDGLISVELFELSGQEVAQVMEGAAPGPHGPWGSAAPPGMQVSYGRSGGLVYTAVNGRGGPSAPNSQLTRPLLHRGFCFVEFASHEVAHRALRTMLDRTFAVRLYSMWEAAKMGQQAAERGEDAAAAAAAAFAVAPNHVHTPVLRVDWAEPLPDVPDAVMEQVRTLYVSNLPPLYNDASEDALAALFASATPSGGGVERCKRLKNYAFVHFSTRGDAEVAMNALQNHVIAGHAIKIQWSKPPPRVASAAGMMDPGVIMGLGPHMGGGHMGHGGGMGHMGMPGMRGMGHMHGGMGGPMGGGDGYGYGPMGGGGYGGPQGWHGQGGGYGGHGQGRGGYGPGHRYSDHSSMHGSPRMSGSPGHGPGPSPHFDLHQQHQHMEQMAGGQHGGMQQGQFQGQGMPQQPSEASFMEGLTGLAGVFGALELGPSGTQGSMGLGPGSWPGFVPGGEQQVQMGHGHPGQVLSSSSSTSSAKDTLASSQLSPSDNGEGGFRPGGQGSGLDTPVANGPKAGERTSKDAETQNRERRAGSYASTGGPPERLLVTSTRVERVSGTVSPRHEGEKGNASPGPLPPAHGPSGQGHFQGGMQGYGYGPQQGGGPGGFNGPRGGPFIEQQGGPYGPGGPGFHGGPQGWPQQHFRGGGGGRRMNGRGGRHSSSGDSTSLPMPFRVQQGGLVLQAGLPQDQAGPQGQYGPGQGYGQGGYPRGGQMAMQGQGYGPYQGYGPR